MIAKFHRATTLSEFISREYEYRHTKNPSYSLRAFARDIGISSTHLSDVLRGRNGLSRKLAAKVGESLKLSDRESETLWTMIEVQFSRSQLKRNAAQKRLGSQLNKHRFEMLSLDVFKTVAEWYHFAILELSTLKNANIEPTWVAKQLGITKDEAKQAIERLVGLGLAKLSGKNLKASDLTAVGDEAPSEAIRSFHKQVIAKALDSVDGLDMDRRYLSSNFIAIRKSDLEAVREAIRSFADKVNEDFATGADKDELYALGIQFFDIRNGSSK